MTDIEKARALLLSEKTTIALCRGEDILTSEKRGIAPMLGFIKDGVDLDGYSAADRIVGKAAALLFVLVGIKNVYAEVLSESGAAVLHANSIPYSYGTLCDRIINRAKTGICPMEQAVTGTESPGEAYAALVKKVEELRNGGTR